MPVRDSGDWIVIWGIPDIKGKYDPLEALHSKISSKIPTNDEDSISLLYFNSFNYVTRIQSIYRSPSEAESGGEHDPRTVHLDDLFLHQHQSQYRSRKNPALHHGHENNSHPPPATARHKAGLPVRICSHFNPPNSSPSSCAPLTSLSILQPKLHPNPPPPAPRHASHLRLLHRAAQPQQARPTRLSLERVRGARQGRAELYPAAESTTGSAGREKACAAEVVSAQGSEEDDGGAGGAFCVERGAGELGAVCNPFFF
jgi:hypothetical protein